jgi:hypothetical protein
MVYFFPSRPGLFWIDGIISYDFRGGLFYIDLPTLMGGV